MGLEYIYIYIYTPEVTEWSANMTYMECLAYEKHRLECVGRFVAKG